jgi:hypothetical protein
MPASRTIEMEPVYTERVTPRRYLRIFETEPQEIDSVQVVPPRVGVLGDFGGIEIKRKSPIFRMITPAKTSKTRSVSFSISKSGRFEIVGFGKKRKAKKKKKATR